MSILTLPYTGTIESKARQFAIPLHQNRYDGKAYVTHLDRVFSIFCENVESLPYPIYVDMAMRTECGVLCYLHDIIEDVPNGYSLIKEAFGADIANKVQLLSRNSGIPRSNKDAMRKYYEGIASDTSCTIVKLCDRIANIEYSKDTNNTKMLAMYDKEHDFFVDCLYNPDLYGFFDRLGEAMEFNTENL